MNRKQILKFSLLIMFVLVAVFLMTYRINIEPMNKAEAITKTNANNVNVSVYATWYDHQEVLKIVDNEYKNVMYAYVVSSGTVVPLFPYKTVEKFISISSK